MNENKFEELLAQMYLLEGINNRNFNVNDPTEFFKNTNADTILVINQVSKEAFLDTYEYFALERKEDLIKMYDRILERLSLYEERLVSYDTLKINAFDTSAQWYRVNNAQSLTSPDSVKNLDSGK